MRQEENGGNGIKDWDCVNKYFGGCIKLNLTYKMKINNLTNSLFLGGNGGSKANLLNSYWICKKNRQK